MIFQKEKRPIRPLDNKREEKLDDRHLRWAQAASPVQALDSLERHPSDRLIPGLAVDPQLFALGFGSTTGKSGKTAFMHWGSVLARITWDSLNHMHSKRPQLAPQALHLLLHIIARNQWEHPPSYCFPQSRR